jgi:integrase
MQNIFIYFWRRHYKDSDKRVSVYCRITVNGQRVNFATDVKVENRFWDQAYQLVKGTTPEAIIANRALVQLRNRINDTCSDLRKKNVLITPKAIKKELDGGTRLDEPATLLASYKRVVDRMKGGEYAQSSITKISRSYSGLVFFITKILGRRDITFEDVNYKFIKDFEDWSMSEGVFHGRSKKRWKTNYFISELSIIKRLVEEAFKMGIITSTPFVGYTMKRDSATFKFLTEGEVKAIDDIVFSDGQKNLEEARDVFIFCCYTGLAFADVHGLKKDAIVDNSEFGMCINKDRQKSKVEIFVPILDKPKNIIQKYENEFSESKNVLPVIPYHSYREALSSIERLSGIKKPIKSHVARHTAATYFLNNNIPEEVVCKALGLSSVTVLRSTYGKFLNNTVAKHFKILNNTHT